MPSNSRADNQYYGKYRECCVVAQLNNEAVEYHEDYDFTDNERSQLFNEARLISDFLGQHKATYLGNHTASESGDILLDNGEVIEIKSVSAGTGILILLFIILQNMDLILKIIWKNMVFMMPSRKILKIKVSVQIVKIILL